MASVSHQLSRDAEFLSSAQTKASENGIQADLRGDHTARIGKSVESMVVPIKENRIQRWLSRAGRFFEVHVASLVIIGTDREERIASLRDERFNARLKVFSHRVEGVISKMAKPESPSERSLGDNADLLDVLETLRNDIKLIKAESPKLTAAELLNARLDIEIDKLSDTQLEDLHDAINQECKKLQQHLNCQGKRSLGLDTDDQGRIYMLTSLKMAVIRHQSARENIPGNLIANLRSIDSRDPVECRKQAQSSRARLAEIKKKLYVTPFIPGRQINEIASHLLAEEIRMELQKQNLTSKELGELNRHILNVAHTLRTCVEQNETRLYDIWPVSPEFRIVKQAIRNSFIRSLLMDDDYACNEQHESSPQTPIGNGAFHVAYRATYDNSPMVKVFKKENDVLTWNAFKGPNGRRIDVPSLRGANRTLSVEILGIDQSSPQLSERAVVTSRYDDKLEFNVVAKTRFGSHDGHLGTVQDLIPGKVAREYGVLDNANQHNRAELQRQMTQLQILDCLTGQVDRHRENYLVHVTGNDIKVTGIDSDFCMGHRVTNARQLVCRDNKTHFPGLPMVMDEDMAQRVLRLTPEHVKEICGDMFCDAEVAAAISRLEGMKTHIHALRKAGRILITKTMDPSTKEWKPGPDHWGSAKVERFLDNQPERFRQYQHQIHGFQLAKQRHQQSISQLEYQYPELRSNYSQEIFKQELTANGSIHSSSNTESSSNSVKPSRQANSVTPDVYQQYNSDVQGVNEANRKIKRLVRLVNDETNARDQIRSYRSNGNHSEVAIAHRRLQVAQDHMRREFGIPISSYFSRDVPTS
ncbi:hypothetical protein AB1K70_03485 [Bremerella sp. JC770]|uniref:hypothetical protein n=1 Tax=Bremerella sp. JC770 TaxID=3232137 RepID=UPI003458A387